MVTEEDKRMIIEHALRRHEMLTVFPCLYEVKGCSGDVIRSHTIQNSQILGRLCEDNHVVTIESNGRGKNLFRKTGRNEASVFKGLCAKHDSEIFASIDLGEGQLFDIKNEKMLTLMVFRGACREYFLKKSGLVVSRENYRIFRTRNLGDLHKALPYTKKFKDQFPWDNFNVNIFQNTIVGTLRALIDIEPFFSSVQRDIDTDAYESMSHIVLEFDGPIKWAASSVVTANHFFDGSKTVNNYSKDDFVAMRVHTELAKMFGYEPTDIVVEKSKTSNWKILGFNAFPNGDKTAVVFSYRKCDEGDLGKFRQILDFDEPKQRQLISQFIIANLSNIVLTPSFVEQASLQSQEAVIEMFFNTLAGDLSYEKLGLDLFADGPLGQGL